MLPPVAELNVGDCIRRANRLRATTRGPFGLCARPREGGELPWGLCRYAGAVDGRGPATFGLPESGVPGCRSNPGVGRWVLFFTSWDGDELWAMAG